MSTLPIEPARTALLVMDCDNDVVHPKGGSAFWQQVHEAIASLPQDFIVHKKRVSAFYGTDLEVVLRTRRIDTLALTDVSTNFVVESTARCGSDAGYRVLVLEDCCSAPCAERSAASPEMHNFAVRKVLPMLCTVASSQDFLAGLGTSR